MAGLSPAPPWPSAAPPAADARPRGSADASAPGSWRPGRSGCSNAWERWRWVIIGKCFVKMDDVCVYVYVIIYVYVYIYIYVLIHLCISLFYYVFIHLLNYVVETIS